MNNNFDPSNAVAVSQTSNGAQPADTGNFNVDNAIPADANSQGNTAWESFRSQDNDLSDSVASAVAQGQPTNDQKVEDVSTPQPTQELPNKPIQSPTTPQPKAQDQEIVPAKPHGTVIGPSQAPDEGWLNAGIHTAEGAAWNLVAKPILGMKDADMDRYLSDLEKQHPISTTIAGTAPYMASAALFPETLLPNVWGRMAVQFGAVGALNAIGHERVDESMKSLPAKALTVAQETGKAAAFSPIWAKAQELKFIGRPFATALARSGLIGVGSATMSTFFGDNITQAFKQGGILGALSLISEGPHLAHTVIGRGIINHANDMYIKAGFPEIKMDPDSPEFPQQLLNVTKGLAKQVPGVDKPQIVSASLKLNDGTIINGVSHEDALEKIGHTKETLKEHKTIPEVNLEGEGKKIVKDSKGNTVGKVSYGNMEEEGITLDIDKKRKGFGTGTVSHVFNQGVDIIKGDVGKDNTDGQKFWRGIGAKLNPTDSGNFKLILTKEDFNKATSGQGKYQAGFTVLHPDGRREFITRDQSMEAPYNLPNGHSEDVKGLNESKFMQQPPELKIVNPQTLKLLESNAGKMDIAMIPGVTETAEVLKNSHEELKEKFRPYAINDLGKETAEVLRENLGVLARNNDRLEASLAEAKRIFDRADKDSSLKFIYNMEEGIDQENKDLQKVANVLRNLLDTKRDEVVGLGTGKLENWIENYFPHVWEDPKKMGNIVKRMMGKRPFEGTKSFLKKRTIPTTREGIDLGLTPVSYNPIDSVMLKVREMERYLMAHRTIQALKEQGIIKFVRTGEKGPDGFVPIDDRFSTVTYKNDAKELVLAGKYVAQKDAARILNNYLSPGLAGKSYIYDMYRGAGNTLNQFQLGLSAFHLGFTSMDATISKFALGINKLSDGNYAGAIKEFATAPFAPITNILQGRELLQSWYGADKGPLTNTIAELMASAGGRAKMDKFYATGMKDSMTKALKEGKMVTAALKVPFWLIEQAARPIMEYIVPRQKMGVFMDMMKMEMERNPNMSHEQMRGIAQRAWNSVDNRMGQLVYDNLFWNHVTKDLAMASVRSLGWNLGTIREIGGGVKDVVGNVNDVIHGKATQVSYRTAYVMALPIVTGLYGAIYQYLHTGKGPQELKDYFFPKNGGIDNKGQDARISLPTYMKDIYHYTTNPVQTVLNKFSPVNNTVMEMLTNKDFYGVEIRNADDPVMQQIADESKFVATQFLPFGFRNQGRDTRTTLASKIEPFIGITPAPYDINMTAAEKEAYELEKGKIPVGSRTKEQAKHSQDKSKLRSDYMQSKDKSPLDQAVEDGVITEKERKHLIKESSMSNLQRMTQHLTFEEVSRIMTKASPGEMEELKTILEKKRIGKEQRGTWTDSDEAMYAKSFKSEE